MSMEMHRLTQGRRLLDAGHNEEARHHFATCAAEEPENVEALMELGRAQSRLGEYCEALATFKSILDLDPKSSEAHYNTGWILHLQMKDWRGAEPHIEQALTSDPQVAKYHLLAAESARRRGRLEIALQHFETVNRLAPATYGKSLQSTLRYHRIFAGAERMAPLAGWGSLALLYALGLSAEGYGVWFLVASLPFAAVLVYNLARRRWRRAIWAFAYWFLWTFLVYLALFL